jgi:hypothetical protein
VSANEGRRRWWRRRGADAVDLRAAPPVDVREDPDDVLPQLTRLRDSGLLTAAEYETEKQRIEQAGRTSP